MIFIDSRVGSKELMDLLDDACLVELEYGDVMFEGNGEQGNVIIGIERKRIGDLINSINTGRLSGHQLPGLLESYDYVYLVVEGILHENTVTGEMEQLRGKKWRSVSYGKRKLPYSFVWAYLTTLETFCGIRVRCTSDIAETARQVETLYAWWNKEWGKHKGHMQIHKQSPPTASLIPGKPSLVVRIASELPGIGWGRAKEVAATFKTVEEMVMAREEEWLEVEGIGKVTAKNVWRVMHNQGEGK